MKRRLVCWVRLVLGVVIALACLKVVIAGDELSAIKEADHLVPVDPYPGDWKVRYIDELRARLKLDTDFFAQMLVRPSFSGEYAVRLHGGKDDQDIARTETFFLTYSAADKSLWYSMPEHNTEKKRRKVSVAVITVEFPKLLAVRIERLWQRMLLRTRYPQQGGRGLDGTTFEFGMWRMYGETWSPQDRTSPLLFIELGKSLIEYCKAAPTERSAVAKTIESKAAQLENYLDEHASR